MFSSQVPKFSINLDLPQSERWQEVVRVMKEPAKLLLAEAHEQLKSVPWLVQYVFAKIYEWRGGLYTSEIAALARGLEIPTATATVLNCAYELSHICLPRIFGCTAGTRWVNNRGMVHVRTLDWPLPAMGHATSLFRFYKGSREFTAVGVPGQVGILSGMLPGAYSATINWAPPSGMFPSFNFGPTFLLRDVLENCDTFESAFRALRDTKLATSVFFTLCGVEPGEACVIERTRTSAIVRQAVDGIVVQANHHLAEPFVKNNAKIIQLENAAFLAESGVRAEVLERALKEHKAASDMMGLLDLPPVLNSETVQKMVFSPKTGEVAVLRRVAPDA